MKSTNNISNSIQCPLQHNIQISLTSNQVVPKKAETAIEKDNLVRHLHAPVT